MVLDPRQSVLLITNEGFVFDFNPAGLSVAEGPKPHIAEKNVGSLLLDREGVLRELTAIEVLGPIGDSAWRRLWSRLTSWWRIRSTLSAPIDITTADLKAKIVAAIARSAGHYMFYLEDPAAPARITAAVNAATNAREICGVLELGTLDDSLDVL